MKNKHSTNYQFGLPFDNVKIIFNSLVGEPRYKFKYITKSSLIAINEKNENIFTVFKPNSNIDYAYAEELISKGNIDDIKEFGKLFYEFGSASLSLVAALLLRNGNKNSILTNDDLIACSKLGISFNNNFYEFMNIIGIDIKNINSEDTENHLSFGNIIDNLISQYRKSFDCENSFVEFGQILSYTYIALTTYLTGIFINISDKIGISFDSLYSDGNTYSIEVFSDRLIGSPIDNDVKYKLISLLYTYYLITNFYESNLGLSITDKLTSPFVLIGKKISENMDLSKIEEELDISYLTQSDLECKNGSITMMNILTDTSIIENPTVFESKLLEHDCADMHINASYILNFIVINSKDIKPNIYKIIETSNINETNVDILYNHFIDNVASILPHTISPKYFYLITLYAAAFRFIKDSKTGNMKKQASLGLYQAEAIMVFLYKEWFMSNKAYETGTGICCPDIRKCAHDIKAEAYIKLSIFNYNEFISYCNDKKNFNSLWKRSEFFEYTYIIESVNSNEEDLSETNERIKELRTTDNYIESSININDSNSEEYDKNVKDLNEGKVSFIQFVANCYMNNSPLYSYKYINEILENDYQQKTLDKLVSLKSEDMNYSMIHSSKLSKVLSNNIEEVLENEKTDERFEMYFNIFMKNIISLYLCKLVFDNSKISNEDKFNDNEMKDDEILPNIKSNRLFNFLNK